MSSEFHGLISPPVFQNGRYIATKSPNFLSFSACLNSSRPIEWLRLMSKVSESLAYSSWFHLMSSPQCSKIGFPIVSDCNV
jgi:hypothetical protein